jgi:uncharacterized protein (DUF362 family)/Pyruvate/2-oxoacid:ferredoxin oxidoreductase delta subunit
MNPIVSCLSCPKYDVEKILPLLETIYTQAQGPELAGKTVLLKPNILFDVEPVKAVTTHPVFVEAVIRFLQSRNVGKIFVGDAPAIHSTTFKPHKAGIFEVCEKTGAEWVYFGKNPVTVSLPSGKTPVASIIREVDYFFSLPKLKTHELMRYTGAIKNSFGLIPTLHKTKQHAFHRSSRSMASLLVDLNEKITPDFIFMDAIMAMEGPGPGNGIPFPLNLVLGSTNLLAIDIVATKIISYNPLEIETNIEGLKRKKWLQSIEEIVVQGDEIERLIRNDFKLIQGVSLWKMSSGIVLRRIPLLRNLERHPVFYKENCISCKACVNICSVKALHICPKNPKKVIISHKKCIRCFCCHEICPNNAIEIK